MTNNTSCWRLPHHHHLWQLQQLRIKRITIFSTNFKDLRWGRSTIIPATMNRLMLKMNIILLGDSLAPAALLTPTSTLWNINSTSSNRRHLLINLLINTSQDKSSNKFSFHRTPGMTCQSWLSKRMEQCALWRWISLIFGCDSSPRSSNVSVLVRHTCYNCTWLLKDFQRTSEGLWTLWSTKFTSLQIATPRSSRLLFF